MISGAILQILQLLAYLAIGLISVTFPIYAISVTYLRKEKWETEKEREKRMERLRTRISELTPKLNGKEDSGKVTELKEKIAQYETELEGTELGVDHLTAKGAVLNPLILLLLALLTSGAGIHFFHEWNQDGAILCVIFSSGFSVGAIYNLFKTLKAVEYAALRPAKTIGFLIVFGTRECATLGKESCRIKMNKKVELFASAGTDEDNLENLIFHLFIPPEIDVVRVVPPSYTSLQREGFKNPWFTMIAREQEFAHKGTSYGVGFSVIGKKEGEYKIPIKISAKGIYDYDTELILNVVK